MTTFGGDRGQTQGSWFVSDSPVSVLGCTRQIQYCRASNESVEERCEPLRGLRGSTPENAKLAKSERQQEILDTIQGLLDTVRKYWPQR
jgi:hypothetical protein